MSLQRPLFLTFEGLDGSGKSTQCRLLVERLQKEGYTVALYREPGGTRISELIRNILLAPEHTEMSPIAEMLLYFAARNQLLEEKVRPALERGEVVILDRYVDSTLAYQGYGRGLPESDILKVAEVALRGLMPECTFLVDTPVLSADARLSGQELDRFEQEDLTFKRKVRQGFLALAQRFPERYVVLDGTLSIETLAQQVWSKMESLLHA